MQVHRSTSRTRTSSRSRRSTPGAAVPGPLPCWTSRVTGRRRVRWGSRGSVTAETAVLLPVLLVVLATAIGVLACVAAQLRCVDAARAAARVAARGDDPALVQSTGQRLAPPGARVVIDTAGDSAEVVVSARVRPFGEALRLLPSIDVSGRAVAMVEAAVVDQERRPGEPG